MALPSLNELIIAQGDDHLMDQLIQAYGRDNVLAALELEEAKAERPAPSFADRAMASMDPTPEGQAQILQQRGIPAQVEGGEVRYQAGTGMLPVDPPRMEIEDIADLAGDVPPTILSILGGVGGQALAGPPGSITGAALGGMGGDYLRQQMAQGEGSRRDYDVAQTGVEGVTSILGDIGGSALAKVIQGPLRRARNAPGFKELTEEAQRFDVDYDTNLAGTAPIDAGTSSEFAAGAMQRLRESDISGERIRDIQDIPFREEVARAMDAVGSWLPGEGPTATRRSREEVGDLVRKAVEATQRQRTGTRAGLYGAFEEVIDPEVMPDLTATNEAIQEILSNNIFKRPQSGTQGRQALETALDEASNIQSYDQLVVVRQGIFDEADMAKRDPTKLSRGVTGLFDKLYAALKADENAFLSAGGGVGSEEARARGGEAMTYARELFGVEESSFVRRVLGDEERASDIPTVLRTATPEQMKALRLAVGMGDPDILKQGVQGGVLEPSKEGIEAWAALQLEVFKDLRLKAQTTPGELKQRMPGQEFGGPELISGQKLQTELNRWKEGSLEELFGPMVTNDLKRFASIVKDFTLTESTLKNFSNTARAESSLFNDIKDIFLPGTRTDIAIGRVLSRGLMDWLGGRAMTTPWMKRALIGDYGFQNLASPTTLGALGRLGGQAGTRYVDPMGAALGGKQD
jgi:hypothetical protein